MNQQKLIETLLQIGPSAIAVSGGVDSMTLAYVAARSVPGIEIFHAISAAVPTQATERVKRYAKREGWILRLIDAGEFNDPRYRANPVNRCYFCKTNLYGAIAANTSLNILSGTNLDDLDDFRPGLGAAQEFKVRHPFVEASIDKAAIRHIARELGLTDLSELPAAPCLSSRVETGIRIDATELGLVERIERQLTEQLGQVALRCRVRKTGLCIEIDQDLLASMPQSDIDRIVGDVQKSLPTNRYTVSIEPYVRGSAFIGVKAHA
jgi:uncharacterized protein